MHGQGRQGRGRECQASIADNQSRGDVDNVWIVLADNMQTGRRSLRDEIAHNRNGLRIAARNKLVPPSLPRSGWTRSFGCGRADGGFNPKGGQLPGLSPAAKPGGQPGCAAPSEDCCAFATKPPRPMTRVLRAAPYPALGE